MPSLFNPLRRVSIGTAIIVPVTVLFLALGLTDWWLVRSHSEQQMAETMRLRTDTLSREVNPRLRQYFETAPALIQGMPRLFARSPELLRDQEFCRGFFLEKIRPFPFVSGVRFALRDGACFGVRRTPDGAFRQLLAEPGETPVREEFALDAAGRVGARLSATRGDERSSPWYVLAAGAGGLARTEPYASPGETGRIITLARPLLAVDGAFLGVIGVDIELASLSAFLREIKPTPGSHVCVLDARDDLDGENLAIASSCDAPADPTGLSGALGPLPPGACRAARGVALESLRRRVPDLRRMEAPESFRLTVDGAPCRLCAAPHGGTSGVQYVVVSLIPEADLLGNLPRYERERIVLFGVALALAMLVSWLLALVLSRTIAGVSMAARRISEAGPAAAGAFSLPDSRITEIAVLTESFNRMGRRLDSAFDALERRVAERTEELTKANAVLRRTAKDLGLARFVLDRSPIAVFLLDSKGMPLYVNESAAVRRGYSREELLHMRVTEWDRDYSEEIWAAQWERLCNLPAGASSLLKSRHRRRDGSVFPVEICVHMLDYEGRRCLVALVSDITDRVEGERRLRLALTHADQALELTRSGYWRAPLDDSGMYIGSERACVLFGVPSVPGWRYPLEARAACVDAADPMAGAEVRERFRRACAGESPVFDVTYPYRRPDDGRIVWLHDLGVVFRETPQQPGEMFGVVQDVTDIVEARRELETARNAAESASRLKTEFLANMSHEIRTPMNAILGYAQLLRRDASLSAVCHAQVETINRAGEHLLAIINDILEMSKIEAGRVIVKPVGFDLHALLEELVELYGARAKAKGVALSWHRSAELPRLVSTDVGKLRQALINLVGNAVKFTARGGVVLDAACEEAPPSESGAPAAGEAMLVFSVRDTGPGIPPDEMVRLFRPFVQSAAGHSAGGTGLGLAISRQYAKLLGGDIQVESVHGRGSTFTLRVRARVASASEVAEPAALPRVLRLAPGRPPVRILVADDNPANRDMLSALLTPLGFEVRCAGDGAEVLKVCESWRPHAILMDVRMPVMDGYEACRRIKAMPGGASVYVMALTAAAFEEQKAAVLACGADDFMRKPFDQDELLAVLGERLHLDYLYAPISTASGPVAADSAAACDLAASVPRLEPALAVAFAEACRSADYERLLELCDRLELTDPAASRELRAMVCAFNYEGVARLFSLPA